MIINGRKGGKADSVAVVKCWLEVLRHALRTLMMGSGSAIYIEIDFSFDHSRRENTDLDASLEFSLKFG